MLADFANLLGTSVAPLLGLAIALSGWMTLRHGRKTALPGCGTGCKAAAESRWSRLFWLPVAAVGCAIYVLTLIAWFWRSRLSVMDVGPTGTVLVAVAWMIIAAGLWFTVLQLFLLRHFCVFCTLIHGLTAVAAVGIIVASTGQNQFAGAGMSSPMLIGGIGVGLLIVSQILIKPKTYLLQSSVPEESSSSQDPAQIVAAGQEEAAPPVANVNIQSAVPGRRISVLSGQIIVCTTDWPLLGSPEADNVLVFLFDYTCAGCRQQRRLLEQAKDRYGARLAILEIPIPMSPSCNPGIKLRNASHPYACAYARLGLDVWINKPDQYAAYAQWIFADGAEAPALGLARQEASRLTKTELFDPNSPDSDLDAKLQAGLSIYHSLKNQSIPALLLPHGVLNGHAADLDQLLQIFASQIGPA